MEPNVEHAHFFPDMADVVRIDDPAIVVALAIARAAREAGLLDERGNLRRIVGTLPVTADGVIVMPGSEKTVWHPNEIGEGDIDSDCKRYEWSTRLSDGSYDYRMYPVDECYSSHEAAERAAEERSDAT